MGGAQWCLIRCHLGGEGKGGGMMRARLEDKSFAPGLGQVLLGSWNVAELRWGLFPDTGPALGQALVARPAVGQAQEGTI